MPFGLPVNQDAAYADLVTGVQANAADLSDFGKKLVGALTDAINLNNADLTPPAKRIVQALNAGAAVNNKDLETVANSIAQILAAGAQANAAGLMSLENVLQDLAAHPDMAVYYQTLSAPPAWLALLDELADMFGTTSIQAPAPPPPAPPAPQPVPPPAPGGGAAGAAGAGAPAGPPANTPLPTINCPPMPGQLTLPDWELQQYALWDTNDSVAGPGLFPGIVGVPFPGTTAPIPISPSGGYWLSLHPEITSLAVPPGAPTNIQFIGGGIFATPTQLFCWNGSEIDRSPWVINVLGTEQVQIPPPEANGMLGVLRRLKDQFSTAVQGTPPPGTTTGTPPPPPPPPAATVNVICDFPPLPPVPFCGQTGTAPIGSELWCKDLAALAKVLADYGNEIYKFIDDNLDPNKWFGQITIEPLATGILNAPANLVATVHNIYSILKCIPKAMLMAIRTFLRDIRSLMCASGCNYEGVIGIEILLALVTSLEKTRLGSDAGVWATVDFKLEFSSLKELLLAIEKYLCPMEIPGIPEAMEAYLQGQITQETAQCWIGMKGGNWDVWRPVLLSRAERLSADEVISQGHRQQWQDADIDKALQKRGWIREEDRQWRQELFWEIPTIGDHLHWLSRNVDDVSYVQQYGLLDGFSNLAFIQSLPHQENYQILTDTHDRDFWGAYGKDLTAQGMKPEYAAAHYAAHWIQPAPEQMKEFVYRLRPSEEPGAVEFTATDYDRILAEQDYAPLAREWFAATLYRVPALTYLIGMFRQSVITDDDLASYHQDLGYTEDDSKRFVALDKIQKFQIRTNLYRGWTPTAIGNGYVTGQLTDLEVRNKVLAYGGTVTEADDLMAVAQANLDKQVWQRARSKFLTSVASKVTRAIDVGTLTPDDAQAALVAIGWPADKATGVVQAQQASSRTAIIRQTVASVKRSFHDGYLDAGGAGQLLSAAGIVADKVNEYLSLWAIQNTPRRKRRTAKEIVNDLAEGMMDTPEALMRLWNLGYNQADSLLYIADAKRQIIGRQAKAIASAQRDVRTQASMLQKLQKQAQQQAKKLRGELQRIAPRSVLQKWLAKGIISLPVFTARMTQLGYPLGAIQAYAETAPTDPKIKELQTWLKAGEINDATFIQRAVELGYTAADAERYRQQIEPPSPSPSPPA